MGSGLGLVGHGQGQGKVSQEAKGNTGGGNSHE